MSDPLCQYSDVEAALLRPLAVQEEIYVDVLIDQASALLRNAAPSIDARIARYKTNPQDLTAVSPMAVATVVAGAVKRYIRNPEGIASQSTGPYSVTYALRSEKSARGVLQITVEDLQTLFPNRKRLRAGTIRTRPGLAPRPVGRYGPLPGPEQVISAVVDWAAVPPVEGAEVVEWALGPDGSAS